MTAPPHARTGAAVTGRDRAVIYLAVLMALFLAALDQTIVATALPAMVADLEGVERYAWVATAYLLASTALALVYGKLSDTYSRKYVTLGAVGLFLTGSFLCGLSGEFGTLPILGDGMTQLVLFRALQGAGGGGIFAMAFIVIADLYTPAERGKYQGFVGAVFGISSILGPLLGGILTDHAGGIIPGVEGWRWVFYVNMPIGGLALWFIIRRMPRLDPPDAGVRPDYLSAVLLLGALVPLILALQIDHRSYPILPNLGSADVSTLDAWLTLGLVAFGAVTLVAFLARSRTSRSPVLDLGLFENDVFRRANAATFFFGASFMSITIFLPLFLVNVLGVSATRAGAALIPLSLGLVTSATLAGQYVNRIGYRVQLVSGAALLLVSVVLLATMQADVGYGRVTLYMVLAGLGIGPSMPLFTLAIQNAVDVRFIGQATSASQFFRQTGATVGAAVMGGILGTTLGVAFAAIDLPVAVAGPEVTTAEGFVSTGGAELPEQIRDAFVTLAAAVDDPLTANELRAEGERRALETSSAVRAAFTLATQRIYGFAAILVLLGGVLAMRVPELPLRTTHDRVVVSKGEEA